MDNRVFPSPSYYQGRFLQEIYVLFQLDKLKSGKNPVSERFPGSAGAVFVEVEKARTEKKVASFAVLAFIAAMAALEYLPVVTVLASLVGHGHVTAEWCNIAGGCPDR